jgi:RNA polymerase sigma factor (TIGR02999 family)
MDNNTSDAATPSSDAASGKSDLTTLLKSWRDGDGRAYRALIEQSYGELRRIARQQLAMTPGLVTLSPTELLHESLLKIADGPKEWESRAHFFASMSLTLRSVLVDFARERRADKRGGDMVRVTFDESELPGATTHYAGLIALDAAMSELEKLDPRCGAVVHLTYFGGLTREDIAGVLKVSVPTVDRELRFARGWLRDTLVKRLRDADHDISGGGP